MIYWIGYFFWKLASWIFFPLTIRGSQGLPPAGGFILASNHASFLDPMIIGICFWRQLRYVARDCLFKNRVFDFVLHQVGAFPIKRESADIAGIKEILKKLQKGYPVVIFPEGTRIQERKEIHGGVGLVAVKSGLPVVPVFIRGSDKVLGPGAKFPRRHPVTVSFGSPKTYSKITSYQDIARQIMQDINSLRLDFSP